MKAALTALLILTVVVGFFLRPDESESEKSFSSVAVKSLSQPEPSRRVPAVVKPAPSKDNAVVHDRVVEALPSDLNEYAELRKKVVRTESQKGAWQRRLTDSGTRRAAVEQLNRNLDPEDRMTAVGYLLEGLSAENPTLQGQFVDSVEQAILAADVENGSPAERRERGADVAELAVGLAIASPTKATSLKEKTKGPKQAVIDRALKYLDRTTREIAELNEAKSKSAK